MDMTVREWTLYHHHYVHQAYRYGDPEMQQRWLNHDILKSPFDCWIYQELIYKIKPDYIIELGIMFGGATHFYASICDLVGHGKVLGIDISLAKVESIDNERITLIEGSSSSQETFDKVKEIVNGGSVLVIADSDHEKNHCLAELRLFSQLVTVGSYYVVEDSLNDPMHWHPVPNEGPQAAALAFMEETDDFVVDTRYAEKYIFSLSPLGFLLRIK
jgi:cephalosporin hydroxylase